MILIFLLCNHFDFDLVTKISVYISELYFWLIINTQSLDSYITVIFVQVNSGVLSVCTAFLSGEPATRLRSQELQQLIAALLEFMAVCKRAIRVHFRLIGEEDQDFHTQLVNGFQSLTAELSHYIPAILSEL